MKTNVRKYRRDNPEKLTTQDEKKTKRKHNTICIGHRYKQANTDNVNKT